MKSKKLHFKSGDIVGMWCSAPWDEEVPIFRKFEIVHHSRRKLFLKGLDGCDEDDFLDNVDQSKLELCTTKTEEKRKQVIVLST